MRIRFLLFLLVVLTACAKPATAQGVNTATTVEYLKPGDVIRLWVFRESAYSGDFAIASQGRVVLPAIGEVEVTRMSPENLRAFIIQEFSKTLRNPVIDVKLLRRVNVLGAVQQPGVILVDETMTVAHVLGLAGGSLPSGKQDEVQLYRGTERLVGRIHGAMRIADLPLQSDDQLFVPERNWVSRNATLLSTAISAVVSIGVALIVSR